MYLSGQETQYMAKDLAASLDVTTSTLRRWAIALEGAHYPFERNEKGQRIYTEQDIATLEELKRLLGEKLSFADAIQQLTGQSKTKEYEPDTKKLVMTSEELEKLISHAVKKAVKKEREKLFKQLKKQMKKEMEKLRDKS